MCAGDGHLLLPGAGRIGHQMPNQKKGSVYLCSLYICLVDFPLLSSNARLHTQELRHILTMDTQCNAPNGQDHPNHGILRVISEN